MKSKYKVVLICFLTFSLFFLTNYLSVANNDLIWNYGFADNFSKGLKMYYDYNMVITPFYPFTIGLLMRIFGSNMIIFYIINTIIPTTIMMMVYKEDKKLFIPVLLALEFVSFPNYNCLNILLLFIVMGLERKDKNDYLIGLVLGLSFLTKSSIGLFLCFPSLIYFKNFRKILKRIIGFLLPNLLFIIYFYLNESLYSYINFAFLGLFDFASNNGKISVLILVTILCLIYLIKTYIKTKDKEILYVICFQIMAYPIFNVIHVLYAFVPVMYIIVKNLPKNINDIYSQYYKFMIILIICPIISTVLIVKTKNLEFTDTGLFKYRMIEKKRIEDAKLIKSELQDDVKDVIFVMYEAYMNKYLLDIEIGKYDILQEGNLGYDGVNRVIEEFDSMPKGTKFITYYMFEQGQASEKIYKHVTENYEFIKSFGKYQLYER